VIVTDLQEKEANEILQFLASKGIVAQKVQQVAAAGAAGTAAPMWNVEVPNGQAIEAIAILNRNGLPRRPGTDLLALFQKSGLVSTDLEEQIRYQQGLAAQIANMIRQIDGIIDAYVQLSIPEATNALGQPTGGVVRASVYVKHQGILDNPNSQLVTKIKRLVAASVTGLSYDNVTVVTDRSRFTDVTFAEGPIALPDEEKEYVSIWSVIVSKDSASRFRSIFFFFWVIVFILAALLAWFIWKLYPIFQHPGSIKQLFTTLGPLELGENGQLQHKKKAAEKSSEEEGETPEVKLEEPAAPQKTEEEELP
jgi:type III secretion protein J